MNANTRTLIDKLERLPPERRAEVADFVDFLEKRDTQERSEAAHRLGEAFKRLDALDEPPMSSEEIQTEVDAVRAGAITLPSGLQRGYFPIFECWREALWLRLAPGFWHPGILHIPIKGHY